MDRCGMCAGRRLLTSHGIIHCFQAAANAKNNQGALKTKLVVSECYADGGPSLKRFKTRAKGR